MNNSTDGTAPLNRRGFNEILMYLKHLYRGEVLINAKLNHPDWTELSQQEKEKAIEESVEEVFHIQTDFAPYDVEGDSLFQRLESLLQSMTGE